ncbi:MAG TPA: sigma 54-interacting transcriptional regulator, partial [Candidatus Udaeobacter sp.]|nr:sigma 54-interacting transcriptional regulator [Candidatus Udaeobacter sp.]
MVKVETIAKETVAASPGDAGEIADGRFILETLRAVTEGTAAVTGNDFFRSLVRYLARALQVRYSFVAECTDANKKNVRTLAFWTGEGFHDGIGFPLRGTPCEKVVDGEVCYYPTGLQSLFPEDAGLVALRAEGYIGVPLHDSSGNILGHLVVMDDKPIRDFQRQLPILQIFAARAGAELERARAHKELESLNAERGVLLDINRALGRYLDRDKLFGALASCLRTLVPTERFGLEFSMKDGKLQGYILSSVPKDGEQTHPLVLPAGGTACDWVMQNRVWFVAASRDEFRERFPVTFDVMTSEGMESLCALPLISGDHPRGALFFMAAAKGAYAQLRREFLEQVAGQIAIAVENMRSYEEIAALNETIAATAQRRQALLNINNAIVTKLTRDELLSAVCDALAKIIRFDRLSLSLYDPKANVLRLVTYAGPYRRNDYTPVGRVLELNDSPAGLAFSKQKPVVRSDLESERHTSSEERAFGHGFRSLCALPLIVRGTSIGAITVGSLTKGQYTEQEAEFLVEIANQIAIAVDNMRAHEETEALKARFQSETIYLQEEIKTEHNFEEIIGQSTPVRQLLRKLEQVAPTDSTVLIQGETGTGKELLARAVHDRSQRKDRPLVKVNCGSIPSGLVESELFGHEKGAFTGATQRRIGRFELANGGTIFLDEVTELPIDTQVKLLRVL